MVCEMKFVEVKIKEKIVEIERYIERYCVMLEIDIKIYDYVLVV